MNPLKCPSIALFACLPLIAPLLHAQAPNASQSIRWISSTQSEPWKQLPLTAVSSGQAPASPSIQLDKRKTYQQIDGFGSCFNDLGWQALQTLDEASREKALRALFAPDGANFTLGRVPMGANDFATGWYSFDETPGDYDLKNFSIDHDRQTILPFLHAAMKYQPTLAVWGVPWSPPSWMKTNGAYKGGEMKSDSQTLASYALYFSKYVQAYRNEGIHLYAVMPQNEPKYNNNIYPQAVWSAALMNVFLRDYLAPRLQLDRVKVEIWQGTIVNEKLEDYILPVLDDPKTNLIITGVAYQWGGQDAMLSTHERYPGKKMMQSETECNNGDNSWQQGLVTFSKIIDDMNHFANSYFYWNTALNEEGKSTWGWRQNSLLTVNRSTRQVQYNPEFYSMKHFSASVLPGAVRIAVTGGPFREIAAFKNPSGTTVLEFENDSEKTVAATIQIGGKFYELQVPANSMNTVTIQAKN
ncbi:MAG: glycoside hydrolase family 30 beta sandwich domain-containing protein [Terracidiphilus sp.]